MYFQACSSLIIKSKTPSHINILSGMFEYLLHPGCPPPSTLPLPVFSALLLGRLYWCPQQQPQHQRPYRLYPQTFYHYEWFVPGMLFWFYFLFCVRVCTLKCVVSWSPSKLGFLDLLIHVKKEWKQWNNFLFVFFRSSLYWQICKLVTSKFYIIYIFSAYLSTCVKGHAPHG